MSNFLEPKIGEMSMSELLGLIRTVISREVPGVPPGVPQLAAPQNDFEGSIAAAGLVLNANDNEAVPLRGKAVRWILPDGEEVGNISSFLGPADRNEMQVSAIGSLDDDHSAVYLTGKNSAQSARAYLGARYDSNLAEADSRTFAYCRSDDNSAVYGRTILDGDGFSDFEHPLGSIVAYAGATAPTNWLICDGASLSRTDYAQLFAILGTTYGSVDGSHFNIPNLTGRVPVGIDSSQTEFDALGEKDGHKNHTLTAAQLPPHTHGISDGGSHQHTVAAGQNLDNVAAAGGVDNIRQFNTAVNTSSAGSHDHGGQTGTGAGLAGNGHNNLQPYIVLNYIIRAKKTSSSDSDDND